MYEQSVSGMRLKIFMFFLMASAMEVGLIVFFLYVSTDLITAHWLKLLILMAILTMIVMTVEWQGVSRWLIKTAQFFELVAGKADEDDLGPAALLAQEELLNFPFRIASLSLILWIGCGVFLFITLLLPFLAIFYLWEALLVLFMSIAGGVVGFVFHFYSSKRIIRNTASDLLHYETGYHLSQKTARSRKIQVKLEFSFLTMTMVGMIFIAIMAYLQASIMMRDSWIDTQKMVAAHWNSHVAQGMIPSQASDMLADVETNTGLKFFIIDNNAVVKYGPPPEMLKTYPPAPLVKQLADKETHSQNVVKYRIDATTDLILVPVQNLTSLEGIVYLGQLFDWTSSRLRQLKLILLCFGIGLLMFIITILVVRQVATDLIEPIHEIMESSAMVARGDLSADFNILSEDELGELAAGQKAMVLHLHNVVERIQNAYRSVEAVIHDIMDSCEEVTKGSQVQVGSIEETSRHTQEMNNVIKEVSDNLTVLEASSGEGQQRSKEMSQIVTAIEESFSELTGSVDSTSSSIWEMAASIKQVAGNVEELLSKSEETSSAMTELDASIRQVEEVMDQLGNLRDLVSENARLGVDSVQSTIQGIGTIEESVSEAMGVINALGDSTAKIGKILNVIRDVANQTNLLALNAAIIASQAGEHGKGFAVVSDEIKNLAERVQSSTKEIDNIIRRVQTESRRVVEVMKSGYQNVEQGVNLSYQAGSALEKIQKSAEETAEMVSRITRVTAEQVDNTRRAAQAIETIVDLIHQVSNSTQEQAKGSDQIIKTTQMIKDMTPAVKLKTERQTDSSKQISRAMTNISEMIQFIGESQRAQAASSERIVEAINRIKNITVANMYAMEKLDKNIAILSQQSEVLKGVVELFKVHEEDKTRR